MGPKSTNSALLTAALCAIAATLAACKGEQDGGARPPLRPPVEASTEEASTKVFEGTTGILEVKRTGPNTAVLREVRTGGHDGFDRVVFEFQGADLPGYRVAYTDKPAPKCGSGEPTAVEGQGWLEVRMSPAQAHDNEGRATVKERELRPALPALKEVEATCDFEAQVTWVLGVSSRASYRVLELSNPARLVVDVKR